MEERNDEEETELEKSVFRKRRDRLQGKRERGGRSNEGEMRRGVGEEKERVQAENPNQKKS